MAERISENLQQKLSERLNYYEDIGIRLFYRDRSTGAIAQSPAVTVSPSEIQEEKTTLAKIVRKPEPYKLIPVTARKIDELPVPAGPYLFEFAENILAESR